MTVFLIFAAAVIACILLFNLTYSFFGIYGVLIAILPIVYYLFVKPDVDAYIKAGKDLKTIDEAIAAAQKRDHD